MQQVSNPRCHVPEVLQKPHAEQGVGMGTNSNENQDNLGNSSAVSNKNGRHTVYNCTTTDS